MKNNKNCVWVASLKGAIGILLSPLMFEVGHYIDTRWITKSRFLSKKEARDYVDLIQPTIGRELKIIKRSAVVSINNVNHYFNSPLKILDKLGIIIGDELNKPVYFDLDTKNNLKHFLDVLQHNNISVKYVI
jgi:hypothetical protein